MDWQHEHPGANVPAEISRHPDLVDISWHNDAMPSFVRREAFDPNGDLPEGFVRLWVDYEDPARSEFSDWPGRHRYAVCVDGAEPIYEGEDMGAALKALLEGGTR